ncbi:MAG: SpoIIE family protein phosphatase, partial [Planctomycetota bacterium]|nr:SpoIIE family protein phosphatase [Planctomycetota bacterium]
QLIAPPDSPDGDCIEPMVAPIVVDGHELGSLTLDCRRAWAPLPQERTRLERAFRKIGVADAQLPQVLDAAEQAYAPRRAAAVQSLLLLARNLARRWQQAAELRNRVEELGALGKLSSLLTRHRDVQQVLDAATRMAVEVMGARASLIRLLDDTGKELIDAASCNLSPAYRQKGRVLLEQSELAKAAFAGEVVYVKDMATDPRVIYRDGADREGLVSALIAGMLYRGRPVGLLHVYSAEPHVFSRHEVNLLQSLAQLTAAAIENARLDAHRAEAQRVQRQLHLAADVQRRMIPSVMPKVPGLELAARYVPSYELGGDFFDFINLGGDLGVAIGDVVGKGIAASLLMAGVRGSLRAFAQEVYDIDQIVSRVNRTLCFETLPNEFATVFYGVIHRETLRLTYCNGGHDPGLLLRDGKIIRLQDGGMVLGIDPDQVYQRAVLDLLPGDVLVLHTDGLVDALNFNNKNFGRERVIQAMRDRAHASAQVILDHLLWEMRRFTGLNRNVDDTTIVVIKVTEQPSKPVS